MMEWYILAILSALISGTVPIVEKRILSKISVAEFSSIYSTINFLISLLLLYFVDIPFEWKPISLMFLISIFASLGFYTINKALKKYDISLVSPLRSINPIILLVLAVGFLGEKVTILNIIGISLVALGTYILEARKFNQDPRKVIKSMVGSTLILLALMSACFYAVSSLIDKIVLATYNPLSYIIIIHFFIMLNFFAFNLFEKKKILSWNKRTKSVFFLMLLASILTVSYRLFLSQAIALAFVTLVVAIKHVDSLVAIMLGGEMFHEKHLGKKLLAALIMLAGILLIIIKI